LVSLSTTSTGSSSWMLISGRACLPANFKAFGRVPTRRNPVRAKGLGHLAGNEPQRSGSDNGDIVAGHVPTHGDGSHKERSRGW
jgi:hypothetical protein